MPKLNCLIVDDEPLAREGLAGYVNKVDFLNLAAVADNALSLPQLLNEHQTDLLFLDIQMPMMSGIDFLKISTNLPMVIITTASPHYAIESFQLNVLDYLLKPITFERFFQSAIKAKEYYEVKTFKNTGTTTGIPYFFIRCGNMYEKIMTDDILYIQGLENYVTIFTSKEKYITLFPLKQLEKNLPSGLFLRVHKSFIVSVPRIDRIEGNEIHILQSVIPIGKTYRDVVADRVLGIALWEKK